MCPVGLLWLVKAVLGGLVVRIILAARYQRASESSQAIASEGR